MPRNKPQQSAPPTDPTLPEQPVVALTKIKYAKDVPPLPKDVEKRLGAVLVLSWKALENGSHSVVYTDGKSTKKSNWVPLD